MSTLPASDYEHVAAAVQSWPAGWRLRLAEVILGSLRRELDVPLPRGVPVEQVRGLAAGTTPPPTDETVQRWIEEQRLEKYR